MTPSEAFAILAIAEAEGYDETLIKDAYHRASLERHPDKVGGDTEAQALINEAYEVAMSTIGPNKLARRTSQSLHRLELNLLAERSARRAETEGRSINRRRRRHLDRLRNLSLLVGLTAGVLLLSGDYLFDPLVERVSESMRGMMKLSLGMLTVVFGCAALWMQMQVQRLEYSIESCLEDLSVRRFCAAQLAEVLGYEDKAIVLENDLYSSPSDEQASDPVRSFFGPVGVSSDDLRRLLVPKAVEHRLLEPIDADQFEPAAAIRYRVLFCPSVFTPAAKPVTETPKPMSRNEAREAVLGGSIMTAVFGGVTTYLAVHQRSWWAILPGLIALGATMLVTEGLLAWLRAPTTDGRRAGSDELK